MDQQNHIRYKSYKQKYKSNRDPRYKQLYKSFKYLSTPIQTGGGKKSKSKEKYVEVGENLDQVKVAGINIQDRQGQTALHSMASLGDADAITSLVRGGADVNIKDNMGFLPLHYSCQKGNLMATQTLLDAGSFINLPNKDGQLPIHLAARNGYTNIIKALVGDADNIMGLGPISADTSFTDSREGTDMQESQDHSSVGSSKSLNTPSSTHKSSGRQESQIAGSAPKPPPSKVPTNPFGVSSVSQIPLSKTPDLGQLVKNISQGRAPTGGNAMSPSASRSKPGGFGLIPGLNPSQANTLDVAGNLFKSASKGIVNSIISRFSPS